ncbi:MAG: hypothetical protein HRU01_18080 [Myxococcales bacterium]|nr:hypothetical protein [Myxococcales bacterium]
MPNCRGDQAKQNLVNNNKLVILGRRNITQNNPVNCCCNNTITTGQYYIFEESNGNIFYTSKGCGRKILDLMNINVRIPLFDPLQNQIQGLGAGGAGGNDRVAGNNEVGHNLRNMTDLNKEVYLLIFLVCQGCWDLDFPQRDPLRGLLSNLIKYPTNDIFDSKVTHINNIVGACNNINSIRDYINNEIVNNPNFVDFQFPLVNQIINDTNLNNNIN